MTFILTKYTNGTIFTAVYMNSEYQSICSLFRKPISVYWQKRGGPTFKIIDHDGQLSLSKSQIQLEIWLRIGKQIGSIFHFTTLSLRQ